MSPTLTAGLPPVMACACGVWICCMSHWSGDRLSESEAGAFGRSPVELSALACSSGSFEAKFVVADAPSTRLSFITSSRKDALLDLAIATPIWS